MGLLTTTDAAEVERLANDQVARDPVANTVFGSIAIGVRQDGAAPWAARPEGADGVLAARSNTHTPVGFSAGWTGLDAVGVALATIEPPIVGISGPPDTVAALAARLGRPVTHRMDERLFRLDELHAPSGVAGSARVAQPRDARWLADWYVDFAVEAFGRLPPGFDPTKMVERGVRESTCWVWYEDGDARSFAVAHPPVVGVSRVGPVYTPPRFRRRGFGSAVTAAASRGILDSGDVGCLYTDLANPTSNKIYQAIGYVPVLDRATVRFD